MAAPTATIAEESPYAFANVKFRSTVSACTNRSRPTFTTDCGPNVAEASETKTLTEIPTAITIAEVTA